MAGQQSLDPQPPPPSLVNRFKCLCSFLSNFVLIILIWHHLQGADSGNNRSAVLGLQNQHTQHVWDSQKVEGLGQGPSFLQIFSCLVVTLPTLTFYTLSTNPLPFPLAWHSGGPTCMQPHPVLRMPLADRVPGAELTTGPHCKLLTASSSGAARLSSPAPPSGQILPVRSMVLKDPDPYICKDRYESWS